MKTLTEGHKYQLRYFENAENPQTTGQILQFIEKEPINKDEHPEYWENGKNPSEGTLHTVNDGTTNEEVLEMLIDRMNYLQGKFPCRENAIVITKLQESLMWLKKRTSDRKNRNVEGKYLH